LGPTAVAVVTDYVFGDTQAIGYSIAWTAGPAAVLGAWLIGSGLKYYAATQAALGTIRDIH